MQVCVHVITDDDNSSLKHRLVVSKVFIVFMQFTEISRNVIHFK